MDHRNEKGQVMVLTSIIIGALVLSATAIAGLLMFFQAQQSNDAMTSNMAVFAADAGVEQTLDCYYHATTALPSDASTPVCPASGTLSNGATYSAYLWCVNSSGTGVPCLENSYQLAQSGSPGQVYGFWVQSTGDAPGTERILKSFYATRFASP